MERSDVMPGSTGWSRRNFVQLMSTAALASRASGLALFSDSPALLNDGTTLFVGSVRERSNAIEVFAVKRGKLSPIQSVASERPAAMVISHDHRSLYVVNEISQYNGLPRGTVEAYSIAANGKISLLTRQPLSLSATLPKHAVLSPDGRNLVVTAQGGAVLNTLPVLEDGSLGQVNSIYKLTGDADGRIAKPGMTTFDAKRRLISMDAGTGSLRILRTEENALSFHAHSSLDGEAVPQSMVLHHEANTLYIASSAGIARYSYNSESGQVLEHRQSVGQSARSLALHPLGSLLFSSHDRSGIATWRLTANGELKGVSRTGSGSLDAISIAPNGRSLLAINSAAGTIVATHIDPTSGNMSNLQDLAQVDSPQSLTAIYA